MSIRMWNQWSRWWRGYSSSGCDDAAMIKDESAEFKVPGSDRCWCTETFGKSPLGNTWQVFRLMNHSFFSSRHCWFWAHPEFLQLMTWLPVVPLLTHQTVYTLTVWSSLSNTSHGDRLLLNSLLLWMTVCSSHETRLSWATQQLTWAHGSHSDS